MWINGSPKATWVKWLRFFDDADILYYSYIQSIDYLIFTHKYM